MEFSVINPLADPNWDARMIEFEDATVFHTAAWARTLMEAYRYEPHYGAWYEGESLAAMVPVMEIKSFLTGTRGVSLPFTDFCPMLTRRPIPASEAMEKLSEHGRSQGWKTLETRGLVKDPADGSAPSGYYVHELDLLPGQELLLGQIRSSTRRNIRKSEKQGVHIVQENNVKGLREFCRLNMLTRRDHGLPPQPGKFFHCLFNNLIEPGMGRILLGIYQGKCIASAVFLHFNGHAIYKYGASDRKFQSLRANNLLMWEAIKAYSSERVRTFHFGRTEPENSGLLQFKRGWGAVEGSLEYMKFDFTKSQWITDQVPVSGVHTHLFSRMPLFALDLVGRVLYRHMG